MVETSSLLKSSSSALMKRAASRAPLNPLQKASLGTIKKVINPTKRDGAPTLPSAPIPPSAYPIQGILYLIAHPSLWLNLICPLILFLLFTIAGLVIAFGWFFPLQAKSLESGTSINAAGSWTIAFFLSLVEAVLISLLAFVILLPVFQEKTFHDVIHCRARNYVPPTMPGGLLRVVGSDANVAQLESSLNSSCDLVKAQAAGSSSASAQAIPPMPINTLYDKVIANPDGTFSRKGCLACFSGTLASVMVGVFLRLFVMVITLPINAIPGLGTVVWLYTNGVLLAWEHMITYLSYREVPYRYQRMLVFSKHREEYASFGVAALGLSLVPGFNWIFAFTNVIGAALWAWDAEEHAIKKWQKKYGTAAT